VGRADGDQRRDLLARTQLGDGVAGVDPAHAVRDDVHPRNPEAIDELDQPGGPLRHRGQRGQTGLMHQHTQVGEVLADPHEVLPFPPEQPDLVEPEDAVHQHHRVAQPRRRSRPPDRGGHPPPPLAPPHPQRPHRQQQQQKQKACDEEHPAHG
jgi:hypothetical protein